MVHISPKARPANGTVCAGLHRLLRAIFKHKARKPQFAGTWLTAAFGFPFLRPP
ncbi:hypothetical protein CBM2604_P30029 [Cupriavidus taiwanensis]|nr:hypothetical protein CBM2604_P30029 [Cupriavidus taiwanensis]SOZ51188.1 hypothetical protein CBM2610_P30028 [Cupriavidus taiwanensis]